MAKQAQIFEKTVSIPPEAREDRDLLVALGNLSPRNVHHNLDLSAISEVRFKATLGRGDKLESLRIELVGSRLPYIELRGDSLTSLGAHTDLGSGILRLLGRGPQAPQAAEANMLTSADAEISINPELKLSPAIQRRLAQLKLEKDQIEEQFTDPAVSADGDLLQRLIRKHGTIQKIVDVAGSFMVQQALASRAEAQLQEKPKAAVKEELEWAKKIAEERMETHVRELRRLLVRAEPDHERNAIVEISAGVEGGDLRFAAVKKLCDLYIAAMKAQSAEKVSGLTMELLQADRASAASGIEGYKRIVFRVVGEGAYGLLRHEAGVHRFELEGNKRVTAGLKVRVIPEIDQKEFSIPAEDLKIETSRASGRGGQHVNTTETAVRIEHLPTGTVVEIADQRSQAQNKAIALKVLESRVREELAQRQHDEVRDIRRSQIEVASHAAAVRDYDLIESRMIVDKRLPRGSSRNYDRCASGSDFLDLILAVDQAQFDRTLEHQK